MAVSTKREMTEAPANPPVPEDLLQRVEETIDWEDVLEIHSDTYQGAHPRLRDGDEAEDGVYGPR